MIGKILASSVLGISCLLLPFYTAASMDKLVVQQQMEQRQSKQRPHAGLALASTAVNNAAQSKDASSQAIHQQQAIKHLEELFSSPSNVAFLSQHQQQQILTAAKELYRTNLTRKELATIEQQLSQLLNNNNSGRKQ